MYECLFEPIKIGTVEIKNRVAVAPMNQQGDSDGHPTMQYMSFFSARALGGFGMMTTGSILTSKEAHKEYSFVPYIFPTAFNAGYWTDFAEGVHSHQTGAKLFAQMSPGFGRQTGLPGVRGASPIPFDYEECIAGYSKESIAWMKYHVSEFANHLVRAVPRAMTVEEIHKEEAAFVRASALAILYGFDGIEIHSPHGYLLHEFLLPRCNQRTDEYGGTLRNRARFLLEIVTACRKHMPTVPIVVRLSGREYHKGGFTADDIKQVCIWCEEEGADAISLSNGSGYDDNKHFFPSTPDNDELIEAQGHTLKKAIKIPVIMAGIHTPSVAEKLVKEKCVDMVALGRGAIADPGWPNKVKEGRVKDIVRCTKDNFCVSMAIMGTQGSTRCTQNPEYGKEQYNPMYWPKPMKGAVPETLRRWKPGEHFRTK
jgi:2,4-dienoyl-CoA reductase-like NADH-dependent reductase (Old Yellow Enzyme family)